MSLWETKADIVNDLTQVTGGYVDENFIVRGCRPPPPLRHDEVDDEMVILFGDHLANSRAKATDDCYNPPDLRGIQQMLQMVNDLEDGTNNGATSSFEKVMPSAGDVVVISKLNPNVSEFVPKAPSVSKPQAICDSSLVKQKNFASSQLQLDDAAQRHQQHERTAVDQLVEIEPDRLLQRNNVTTNLNNDEDIKKLSETLKSKINKASKSDSLRSKREKNVAIATLLKLHASKTVDTGNERRSKPVLLPPDYYKNNNPLQNIAEQEAASNTEDLLVKSAPDICKPAEDLTLNNTLDISNITQNISQTPSEPYDANKEIQNSIDKVTEWLNPSTSAAEECIPNLKVPEKKPISMFGPITFRKKETKTQSPVETKVTTTPKKTRRDSKEFVPSQNAAKQSELYMNRIKEQEIKDQKKNSKLTMANLEEALKARDEKIRRALNKNSSNSNSS